MKVNGRRIGINEPMYIIAELSANHGQSYETARRMIETAAACGADAVKLQIYTADTLTLDVESEYFRIDGESLWAGRSLYELYEEACTPWEWYPDLAATAAKNQVDLFASVFDHTALDYVERHEPPAYKIASFELVDHDLVRAVCSKGRPVIMSTGMATLAEIAEAVEVAQGTGGEQLALLRCNSGYPSPLDEMNLRTIENMADTFNLPIGLSDHTTGIEAAVAARCLGATILEKHFVLDACDGALDSAFSLRPHQFEQMVQSVRAVERMLGSVSYGPTDQEQKSLLHRRSLFVSADVACGEAFTAANVRSVRPGQGLPPKFVDLVRRSRARRDLPIGTPITWDAISVEHGEAGRQ